MSITKADDERACAAAGFNPPTTPTATDGWGLFCNGLAQYVTATVVAAVVLAVFFPGNRFLPVPWQHDDYNFLAAPEHLRHGLGLELFCTRPVSTNVLWRLGMLGETQFYIAMFLAATLIPVLALRLALRLFRCQPGPWIVLGLAAGVSACTFLFEHSLWFYRYTGLVTNLTSVVFGLLSAYGFSLWLDGRRAGFVAGCLLFLVSAFAKEDMLLFVPLFVGAEWSVRRWEAADRAPLARLAGTYAAVAVVGGLLFTWNRWVVPSPFTGNQSEAYKLSFSLPHVAWQVWSYATATHLAKTAFAALLAASLVGACRSQRRLAALATVPLIVAMILPYAVLPRFFEYYSLNWLSLVVSLSSVCIAVICRGWLPPRFANAAWLAPLVVLVAIFAGSRSAANSRCWFTAWLNLQQTQNQYVIEQLEHRQDELAGADTIAVRGEDQIFSPWLLSNGAYASTKIGHTVHWLLVVKPQSLAGQYLSLTGPPSGDVTIVLESDLASYPDAAVLSFDKSLNMSVRAPSAPTATARAPAVIK